MVMPFTIRIWLKVYACLFLRKLSHLRLRYSLKSISRHFSIFVKTWTDYSAVNTAPQRTKLDERSKHILFYVEIKFLHSQKNSWLKSACAVVCEQLNYRKTERFFFRQQENHYKYPNILYNWLWSFYNFWANGELDTAEYLSEDISAGHLWTSA